MAQHNDDHDTNKTPSGHSAFQLMEPANEIWAKRQEDRTSSTTLQGRKTKEKNLRMHSETYIRFCFCQGHFLHILNSLFAPVVLLSQQSRVLSLQARFSEQRNVNSIQKDAVKMKQN